MRIYIFLLSFFITMNCAAQSSRQVSERYLAWVGFNGQYNFTSSLNVNLDMQARYEYTDGDWFAWLIRPAVTWKAKNNILFTAGIAFFELYPNPNTLPPRPEWRPWQEVGRKFVARKHTFYPRLRFEQRFIKQYGVPVFEDNFSFNTYRGRFRLDYTYTFHPESPKGLQLFAGNEYMLALNPRGDLFFDQNRAWAGVSYRFNPNLALQLSYLNLFLRKTTNSFDQHHTVRLTCVVQLTKKEKEKSPE